MSDDQFSKLSLQIVDLGHRLDRQGEKIDQNSERLDRVEHRLGRVQNQVDGVERQLEGVNQRLEGVEQHLEGVEQRLGVVEHGQTDASREFAEVRDALAKLYRHTEVRFDEVVAELATKAGADRVYTTLDAIMEKIDNYEAERLAAVNAVDLHDAWIKKASKILDIKYERAA